MDDIERNSTVESIPPVRKIRARIYDRERREHAHPYEKKLRGQLKKRKKASLKPVEKMTVDPNTPAELEQDLKDYKSDLKTRLAFDRAQILSEEPSLD